MECENLVHAKLDAAVSRQKEGFKWMSFSWGRPASPQRHNCRYQIVVHAKSWASLIF